MMRFAGWIAVAALVAGTLVAVVTVDRRVTAGLAVLTVVAAASVWSHGRESPAARRARIDRDGGPCPDCGGTGQRIQVLPYTVARNRCVTCRGSGSLPGRRAGV